MHKLPAINMRRRIHAINMRRRIHAINMEEAKNVRALSDLSLMHVSSSSHGRRSEYSASHLCMYPPPHMEKAQRMSGYSASNLLLLQPVICQIQALESVLLLECVFNLLLLQPVVCQIQARATSDDACFGSICV
jgi:hypothetical protein